MGDKLGSSKLMNNTEKDEQDAEEKIKRNECNRTMKILCNDELHNL
jgi:hypothetical protein